MKGSEEMKRFLELATWSDMLLLFVLIGISFLPFVIFYAQQSTTGERYVVITEDRQVLHDIRLADISEQRQIPIESEDGQYNVVEVSADGVVMSDANCHDQICVRSGKILAPGETIICLPHKVIIEITAEDNADNVDVDIISSFISVKGLYYE